MLVKKTLRLLTFAGKQYFAHFQILILPIYDNALYTISNGIKKLVEMISRKRIAYSFQFFNYALYFANSSKLLLFADDSTLQISLTNIYELFNKANQELKTVSEWF